MQKFPSTDTDVNLWQLLIQTRRVMANARGKELAKYGIWPRMNGVMLIIEGLGGMTTISKIAHLLLLTPHSVSESIARMERLGLVTKRRKERNQLAIELTEKGRELYHQSSRRESMHNILSCLSEEERRQLSSILYKLRNKGLQEIQQHSYISFTPIEIK